MPVDGLASSYATLKDSKTVILEKPTVVERLYVSNGTMEFNRHPSRKTFTIKYKPGTPISDNLKKMNYDFAQQ